ncbi:hypothetical protein IEQ34_007904 [Dendrobium chrysotoxum]|uniref:Uncharacterized protein n=1 Tax=Dendrobium chrysotoxum TaxID=161865 RepID=A0AAV7H622_DENCH|nr:hypothetical protein IEQ34_007904 [Dendrobium chrysotoxum]
MFVALLLGFNRSWTAVAAALALVAYSLIFFCGIIGGTALLSVVILFLSNVALNVPTGKMFDSVFFGIPKLLKSGSISSFNLCIRRGSCLAYTCMVSIVARNLSLLGYAANFICSVYDYNLSFWSHLKFGVPSTIIVTAIGLPLIRICQNFGCEEIVLKLTQVYPFFFDVTSSYSKLKPSIYSKFFSSLGFDLCLITAETLEVKGDLLKCNGFLLKCNGFLLKCNGMQMMSVFGVINAGGGAIKAIGGGRGGDEGGGGGGGRGSKSEYDSGYGRGEGYGGGAVAVMDEVKGEAKVAGRDWDRMVVVDMGVDLGLGPNMDPEVGAAAVVVVVEVVAEVVVVVVAEVVVVVVEVVAEVVVVVGLVMAANLGMVAGRVLEVDRVVEWEEAVVVEADLVRVGNSFFYCFYHKNNNLLENLVCLKELFHCFSNFLSKKPKNNFETMVFYYFLKKPENFLRILSIKIAIRISFKNSKIDIKGEEVNDRTLTSLRSGSRLNQNRHAIAPNKLLKTCGTPWIVGSGYPNEKKLPLDRGVIFSLWILELHLNLDLQMDRNSPLRDVPSSLDSKLDFWLVERFQGSFNLNLNINDLKLILNLILIIKYFTKIIKKKNNNNFYFKTKFFIEKTIFKIVFLFFF